MVFFNADDDEVSYGRAALADYLAGYEGRLMRSLKSLLGTSLIDGQTEVAGARCRSACCWPSSSARSSAAPRRQAGRGFDRAVFGRPVFFIDDDAGGRPAGRGHAGRGRAHGRLSRVAFQYEPIAAAFDYESQIDREELVLIADIGGGTSDFSLVRLAPERAGKPERRDDILATGGVHIGGTDFDKYLSLASVMPLLGYGSAHAHGSRDPVELLLQPGDLAHHQSGLHPQEHRPAGRPGPRRARAGQAGAPAAA